jgi:hypothetical protein
MTRLLVLSLLLLVALPLAADFPPEVRPAEPTSATPVTLIVYHFASCPPDPVVAIEGTIITVKLAQGPCLAPPILITEEIPLGLLAPGDYEVIVEESGVRTHHFSFTVRDAQAEVIVRPSIGPTTGGTLVYVNADVRHCQGRPTDSCPPPAITFDGVAATNVEVINSVEFRARTPAHASGAAEVRISSGEFTRVSRAGFRYYDRSGAPLASMFERVLIPVAFAGPGAHGSQWTTELSVLNRSSYTVSLFRPLATGDPIAGRPLRIPLSGSAGGKLLFVPRESAGAMAFNLLVRDTSRQSEDWGTEVPVVREAGFSTDAVELLNVPVDPRFRLTLRVYGLDSAAGDAYITVYSMETGNNISVPKRFPLSSATPCEPAIPCGSDDPAFALIDVLSEMSGLPASGRIGIRVQATYAAQPIWGFVTVTNNTTQHVTVISPQ